ncbi:hypothetical protein N6H14_05655 [Paenibacillus sp. CC-CFT747]|nr:hypothetical protein N6H14_05655 [Paenibacillus sp. CC-CFT747]
MLALLEQAEERLAERGGVLAAAAVAAACNTGPDKDAHWSVETARERFPDARIAGMEDTEAALEGAFAGGPGILVIAGTGSAAAARTEEGRLLSCGGWGPWFGDEGSGYWLGCEALRAAARAADGRGSEPGWRSCSRSAWACVPSPWRKPFGGCTEAGEGKRSPRSPGRWRKRPHRETRRLSPCWSRRRSIWPSWPKPFIAPRREASPASLMSAGCLRSGSRSSVPGGRVWSRAGLRWPRLF